MRIMEKPSFGISSEELFKMLARSFTDAELRDRLLSYSDLVRRHSEENERRVPNDIQGFLESVLPEQKQVSRDDMDKLYEQKLRGKKERMSELDEEEQTYHNRIRSRAPGGKCPICGLDTATTLDHYIPKSKVPTLAVDPCNLIPACAWCNAKKNARLNDDPRKMPVHIYFDEIPEGKWLHTRVGDKLQAEFYARSPAEWEPGIRSRVNQHLDFYSLYRKYSDDASVEMANLKATWEIVLEELQEDEPAQLEAEEMRSALKKLIRNRRRVAEKMDLNSCASAYYRGLEKNMDAVYAFFGVKEPVGVS